MSPQRQKLLVVAAVVIVIMVVGALLFREIPQEVSAPLFLLVVIIEVIVAPIPGGAVGYLGAARFGFWSAWPLLYAGNVVGTVVVFFLARRYGAPIFAENVGEKTRERYNALLERHPVLLWAVYSVPLLPVDVLSVLAGLSTLSARRFLTIALTGYIFYTAIVAYVGSALAELVGMSEAVSILGAVFFVGLVWWLWSGNRDKRIVYRVALTGNIASGKSAVADEWRRLGAHIIDADELARRAVEPGTDALRRIGRQFGDDMIVEGSLDRAALGRVVFRNAERRRALEAIVHPEVERLRAAEEQQAAASGAKIIVHAIPLLFEAGLERPFDAVVIVDAATAVRLERLVSSRSLSERDAQAMIDAQLPAEEKRARADYVIENNGTLEELTEQAREVWSRIRAAAA